MARERVGRRCRPNSGKKGLLGSTSSTVGGTCYAGTAATPDAVSAACVGHYPMLRPALTAFINRKTPD
jgi:hypothetical protein